MYGWARFWTIFSLLGFYLGGFLAASSGQAILATLSFGFGGLITTIMFYGDALLRIFAKPDPVATEHPLPPDFGSHTEPSRKVVGIWIAPDQTFVAQMEGGNIVASLGGQYRTFMSVKIWENQAGVNRADLKQASVEDRAMFFQTVGAKFGFV
jgi:hypothetical protein